MTNLFSRSFNNIEIIPDWLAQAKTLLLLKNKQTKNLKLQTHSMFKYNVQIIYELLE